MAKKERGLSASLYQFASDTVQNSTDFMAERRGSFPMRPLLNRTSFSGLTKRQKAGRKSPAFCRIVPVVTTFPPKVPLSGDKVPLSGDKVPLSGDKGTLVV
jgi:hypothetical protein